MRAIKSPQEVAAMRRSIAVCEWAMAEMRAALAPGMTENALWAVLHRVNIEQGGEGIESRLLSAGRRTSVAPGSRPRPPSGLGLRGMGLHHELPYFGGRHGLLGKR